MASDDKAKPRLRVLVRSVFWRLVPDVRLALTSAVFWGCIGGIFWAPLPANAKTPPGTVPIDFNSATSNSQVPSTYPAESLKRAANAPAAGGARSFLPESRPGFSKLSEARAYTELCPNVQILSPKKIRFTDMERRLLCGDQHKDQIGQPWSDIPPSQASYFARSFLQSRGYHDSLYYQDGTVLYIKVGELSRLKTFTVVSGPPNWQPPKKRLIEGRPLTPKLLDELQAWAVGQLKNRGYACASADAQADPKTGEVLVHLVPGDFEHIVAIETTGDRGLNSAALDRYNAFRLGDVYRSYLIEVTRTRTLADGFLQSILFSTKCLPPGMGGGAKINRDVLLGEARQVRIAAGGSTDLGALVKMTLQQNRIGASASSASIVLTTSYLNQNVNEQTLNANYKWYYTKGEGRSYLQPQILFDHSADNTSDTKSVTAKILQGYGIEYETGSTDFAVGPVWLNYYRSRGPGVSRETPIYIETDAGWKSHDFEYYASSPRTGEMAQLSAYYTLDSLGADYTAQRVQLDSEKLWSLGNFDPPLLILGARMTASSVFSVGDRDRYRMPPEFLIQAGGDANLRAFSLNSLPRDGLGALSALLGSVEARLHDVIFGRADVFGFLDSGLLGSANFKLREPLFLSPGIGLRWESIIGVLRVYVAEGFTMNEPAGQASYGTRTRLGITFGQEF